MRASILVVTSMLVVCLAASGLAQTNRVADANGFKIGDRVQVLTGFGWIDGTILAAQGNDYRVHAQSGVDVTKRYPEEVRRIGGPTNADRAAGQYALHDKVQVNVNGVWMDGEVKTILNMDYQVSLSGNRLVWANAKNLRPSATPSRSPAPKSGVPPKAGLTSCAGKYEGRYSSAAGGFSNMTIIFRSGKATMKDAIADKDIELECWMGGGKVYLHKPGDAPGEDLPLDINDDGTLGSPFGDLKRKGP